MTSYLSNHLSNPLTSQARMTGFAVLAVAADYQPAAII
jgi:hypothetical protein